MSTIQTVTGYVTSKGVEKTELGGREAYRIRLRDTILVKKGEKRQVLSSFTFWGAYHAYLAQYIAPYDQITIIGELNRVEILEPKEGQVDGLICMDLNGLHCTLPKREDADAGNKRRSVKQRAETLKPDPPSAGDDDIPF
jgi:hypothetical protein